MEALQNLPKDLPETYERVLAQIGSSSHNDAACCKQIFQLVATALRPLTMEELREAVNVDLDAIVWCPDRISNDMHETLKVCGSLVLVDKHEATIHYVHSSVKQFLCQAARSPQFAPYHIEPKAADLFMADVIATYLNYEGKFDTQLEKRQTTSYLATGDSGPIDFTSSIVNNAIPPGKRNRVARTILQGLIKGIDIEPLLHHQVPKSPKAHDTVEHPFLSYARQFWLMHMKSYIWRLTAGFPAALDRLLMGNVRIVELPWHPEVTSDLGPKFLNYIVDNLHWPLIMGALDVLAKRGPFRDTLDYLRIRLPKYSESPEPVQEIYESLLVKHLTEESYSKIDGAIVHWLIQTGTSTAPRPGKDSALLAAVSCGRTSELEALLSVESDIDQVHEKHGTALMIACGGGDLVTAELLLKAGANPNLVCESHGSALQAAAPQGNMEILELLVKYGADIDLQGGFYGSALLIAAYFDTPEFAERLLSLGASPWKRGAYGNAFETACKSQAPRVQKLLASHVSK